VAAIALHVALRSRLLPPEVGAFHVHAIGRLLLTGVCIWAYLAASQLVIVWSANLPNEAGFFLARYRGVFRLLALTLVFGHFAGPFLLLLNRKAKQRSGFVAVIGGWLVLMHAVDMFWLLMPAAPRAPVLFDIAPFLGISALLTAFGVLRFRRLPAVPAHAPELDQSIAYESP
jgi:hypothetical protein